MVSSDNFSVLYFWFFYSLVDHGAARAYVEAAKSYEKGGSDFNIVEAAGAYEDAFKAYNMIQQTGTQGLSHSSMRNLN